jgi:hypothetical protein
MFVHPKPAQVARKLGRLLLLCGLAALAVPGIASAATVQYNLTDLLPGGDTASGFTIGDKRYSNFTFASTGDSPLEPSDVDVRVTSSETNASMPGDDRYQLQFTFGMDAFPGERTDLVICYQVDVLDPNQFINQVGLRFNGSVPAQGPGGAAATVQEMVMRPDMQPVAPGGDSVLILDVTNDGPGRLPDDNSDFVVINPTRTLQFCKDILVSSQPDGGYAAISIVDNIVDQIPEPTALGLAVLAGGGLLFRRRR